MTDFAYSELLPLGDHETPYRLISPDGVSTFEAGGERFLRVEPEALTLITSQAMRDIAHLLRPGHLQQLANIQCDLDHLRAKNCLKTSLLAVMSSDLRQSFAHLHFILGSHNKIGHWC